MSCIILALKWFSSFTRSHLGSAWCFITKQKMHLLKSLLLQGISGFYNTSATQSSDAVPSGCDVVQEATLCDVWWLVFALTWHVKNYTPGQEENLISPAVSE